METNSPSNASFTATPASAIDATPSVETTQPTASFPEANSEADDESSSSDTSDATDDEGVEFHASDFSDDEPMDEGAPVTRNEVVNPTISAPPVTQLPTSTALHPLGTVHAHVGNSVTILAHTHGLQRVLDADTLVAQADGTVVGVVFEVFGPVTQPMYSVRFATPEEAQKLKVGEQVFFAEEWAKVLDTGKLRMAKGTDASNIYDEEVGEEHMEFSDDEEERAAKLRRRKERKAEQGTAQQKQQQQLQPQPRQQPVTGDAPSVAGRKLQSYGDLFDADLGF
ncbi:hypothetical protein LPJ73_003061 [Coemansia sp. RSA 2703]|nr:hypothetical protein LPJ73_003061 [Coemansia sp. RSA 2703]KAJ2373682.1 hypothetical protein IW150_003498 [Coemansia sp. RSA 2607]